MLLKRNIIKQTKICNNKLLYNIPQICNMLKYHSNDDILYNVSCICGKIRKKMYNHEHYYYNSQNITYYDKTIFNAIILIMLKILIYMCISYMLYVLYCFFYNLEFKCE